MLCSCLCSHAPQVKVTFISRFSDLIILRFSFCVQVHFSATVRARLMILGQHLLLDETL